MITRLISAAVGIVITLIVLFLHNTVVLPIVVGILSLIMVLEFFKVNHVLKYRAATGAGMLFALLYPIIAVGTLSKYKMLLILVCTLVVCGEYVFRQTQFLMRSFFGVIAGMYLIPMAMSTLVILNNSHEQHGVIYVVLALCGGWIADSGAYFVGSALGKHKLCPTISPKKTIEGSVFGLLGGCAWGVVVYFLQTIWAGDAPLLVVLILGIVCAVLGQIGDLFASILKRWTGIKDFSSLIPGHGGIMDRLDSILLCAPVVFAAFYFFCS